MDADGGNAVGRKLVGEVLGERGDGDVAHGADDGAGRARGEPADVDDAARLLLDHVGRHLARHAQVAQHLDVHVGPEVLVGDLAEHGGLGLPADLRGAVDENIDAAEGGGHLGNRLLHGGVLAGVGGNLQHLDAALALDLGRGRRERRLVARNERHVDAFPGELPGDRLADAAVAAGDDRCFAFELEIHGVGSLVAFPAPIVGSGYPRVNLPFHGASTQYRQSVSSVVCGTRAASCLSPRGEDVRPWLTAALELGSHLHGTDDADVSHSAELVRGK